jgi:hypothetical protein
MGRHSVNDQLLCRMKEDNEPTLVRRGVYVFHKHNPPTMQVRIDAPSKQSARQQYAELIIGLAESLCYRRKRV